jgi:hypothetical protein
MTEPTRATGHDDPNNLVVRRQRKVLFTGAEMEAELKRLRALYIPLLTAAQHAIAACPRCQGRGYVVLADSYHGEKWPIDCEACQELRAAVQAAEGE